MPKNYYDVPQGGGGGGGGGAVPEARLLPAAGKTGQPLLKTSDGDYVVGWGDPQAFSLLSITAFLASDAGVRDASTNTLFRSADGDFLVRAELTAGNPRFGFQLPAGRTLIGIYEGGLDVTADFTAGAARTYTHNYDVGEGAVQYLIRTEESA